MHFFYANVPAEAPTTDTSLLGASSRCSKCGTTKKSDRHSCCAPGGAWFKNCGDAGDKTFDHTWAEGIHACKDYGSSVSEESPQYAMHHPIEVVGCQFNNTQSHDETKQETHTYSYESMSDDGTTRPEDCFGLFKATIFIYVLSITPINLI